MHFEYHTLDVFTDRVFGGNPLAVFPEADGLSDAAMRAIARELNLSETVFVFPGNADMTTRRVRILTPRMELPFAGHPTIGTAILLADLGRVPLDNGSARIVLGEGVGPVPVEVGRADDGSLRARLTAARPPERGPAPPPLPELAALLGLRTEDLLGDVWPPAMISLGVPFMVVPVRDAGALARIRLDLPRWTNLLSRAWAPHVYAVAPMPAGGPAGSPDFRVRMFAPAMGIAEDPATGAGATVLAAYLSERQAGNGPGEWIVEQGVEMGRPSRLAIRAEWGGDRVSAVHLSGSAVRVARGVLDVPDDLVTAAAREAGAAPARNAR